MSRMPAKDSPVWIPIRVAAGALLFTLGVLGIGGAFFGGPLTWDLLVGIASPTAEVTKASPVVAWAISVLGYVLVPVFIGLLVGGMAEFAVQSRLAPLEQRMEKALRFLEEPSEDAPSSGSSGEVVP